MGLGDRARWFGLGAVVAGVLVGGIAYASIPSGGSISACYANKDGAVRIIDSAQQCGPKETAISWSQQGPSGPSGPGGASGPSGPAGSSNSFTFVESAIPVPAVPGIYRPKVTCPSGSIAISGGWRADGAVLVFDVLGSQSV